MRFLKADKIFNGRTCLSDDAVLVLDNQNLLKEIVSEKAIGQASVERLQGILTPGFVNAHCHLELSHLKGKISQNNGLPAFAKQVVSLRHTLSKEDISSHMQQANLDMWERGIVAVGDISNTEDSFEEKRNSKLFYHTFIELIGLNPANSRIIFEKGQALLEQLLSLGLSGSLAPHAPYSTSKELIKRIADHNSNAGLSFSIHNEEREEEIKFLMGKPSAFEELYRSLGLDLSWFKAPGQPSLYYYLDALSDKPSLLVHNTFTTAEEIKTAAHKAVFWCFCPSANLYIENRLPGFSAFSEYKNKICIGTDSLASNSKLDVIQEANLILENTRVFSLEDMLRALTFNGAEALGISEDYGQFSLGKNAGLNLVEFKNAKLNFIKRIV